jgi:hypothetical protein
MSYVKVNVSINNCLTLVMLTTRLTAVTQLTATCYLISVLGIAGITKQLTEIL